MRILASKRSKAILGGVLGTGIAGGTAIAAILLTTVIDGTASVNTVGTANELEVSASTADGSALDCSDFKVSSDFTKLTLNPVLTKTVNGSNSGTTPVKGGQCTITVKIKNTGTSTIRVQPDSGLIVPDGWTTPGPSGSGFESIAPGGEGTVSQTIVATEAARDGGKFGGKLVYADS